MKDFRKKIAESFAKKENERLDIQYESSEKFQRKKKTTPWVSWTMSDKPADVQKQNSNA